MDMARDYGYGYGGYGAPSSPRGLSISDAHAREWQPQLTNAHENA